MSKDKISAQDIIDSLAQIDGITKRLSEDFFKALIATIEEALLKNELVKIKGLGTFKLQWVAPRRSVNVQTGEDILLAGYYKVNFSPDAELKSLVNKPFEHLEAVALDEESNAKKEDAAEDAPGLSSLAEQANEIKGLLSEINAMTTGEETEGDTEPVVIVEQTVVVTTELAEPEKKAKVKKEVKKENVAAQELISVPKVKKRGWVWTLVVTLLLLIVLFFFLFFYSWKVNRWVKVNVLKQNVESTDLPVITPTTVEPVEIVAPADSLTEEQTQESTKEAAQNANVVPEQQPATSTVPATPAEEKADDWQSVFDNRMKNPEYIETIRIPKGVHLARLADQYYGSPYFWVYIFEANKEEIKNPNQLKPEMKIKMPKLDPRLIDVNDPHAIEKARELEKLYTK